MGDQHDRHAELRLHLAQQVEDLRLDRHVERGRRLVGDQQFGAAGQRHRDHHALAHAARELVRVVVDPPLRRRDVHQAQHLDRPVDRLAPAEVLVQAHHLGDLLADRVDRVERGHRLLEDDARSPCCGCGCIASRAERHEVAALPQDLPATILPGGIAISFSTDIAVTVLPQPDSPTTPSVSPRLDRQIDAVDRAHHAVIGREMRLEPADFEQRSLAATASEHPARIERVAQPVADKVDRQHRRERSRRRRTAPNAARRRDSPWRRTECGPRSGCRAESRGRETTASIPR